MVLIFKIKYIYGTNLSTVLKKLFFILLNIGFYSLTAQQSEAFREVKDHFDDQRSQLEEAFKKSIGREETALGKIAVQGQYKEFMTKLDSIQNEGMVYALIITHNRRI